MNKRMENKWWTLVAVMSLCSGVGTIAVLYCVALVTVKYFVNGESSNHGPVRHKWVLYFVFLAVQYASQFQWNCSISIDFSYRLPKIVRWCCISNILSFFWPTFIIDLWARDAENCKLLLICRYLMTLIVYVPWFSVVTEYDGRLMAIVCPVAAGLRQRDSSRHSIISLVTAPVGDERRCSAHLPSSTTSLRSCVSCIGWRLRSGSLSSVQSWFTNVYTGLHLHTLSTSSVRWQMSRLVSDYVLARLHHWSSAAPDCLLSATELFRSPLLVSGTVCLNMSLLHLL